MGNCLKQAKRRDRKTGQCQNLQGIIANRNGPKQKYKKKKKKIKIV